MAPSKPLKVVARGKTYEIAELTEGSRVHELLEKLNNLTGLDPSTLKIFLPGTKGFLRLQDAFDLTLEQAGMLCRSPDPSPMSCMGASQCFVCI